MVARINERYAGPWIFLGQFETASNTPEIFGGKPMEDPGDETEMG
jgi:hypothetical protein